MIYQQIRSACYVEKKRELQHREDV